MKALIAILILAPAIAHAQGTAADYARANGLRARYEALALNVPGRPPGPTTPASFGTAGQ